MSLLSGSKILDRLRSGEKFIADGAIGSEIIRNGVATRDILAANITFPYRVRSLHQAYLEAGADILTTNTFGMPDGLQWPAAMQRGIQLGIDACIESPRAVGVWVSLIPRMVVNEIDTLRSLMRDIYPRPEIFLLETCTSLAESLKDLDALGALEPSVVCVTCHFTDDGRMLDGTDIHESIMALTSAGANIVGANCGDDATDFDAILSKIKRIVDLPTLIQPNAGLPIRDTVTGGLRYPLSPEQFSRLGSNLFHAGAGIVGGCCGTSPAHIAALLRNYRVGSASNIF